MMKSLNFVLFIQLFTTFAFAQSHPLFSTKGHSHNDYRRDQPFLTAFETGMGSVEADVILRGGNLCVAHCLFQVKRHRTLEKLYLDPIAMVMRQNKAYPMQLVIDIKSKPKATLQRIIAALERYPDVFNAQSPIKIIISGRRPHPSEWAQYPAFVQFDGRPNERYTDAQMARIGMVSDNFNRYKRFWKRHIVPNKDSASIQHIVDLFHRQGKAFRLWKAPDNKNAWERLIELGVDFINTDKPHHLNSFFRKMNNEE